MANLSKTRALTSTTFAHDLIGRRVIFVKAGLCFGTILQESRNMSRFCFAIAAADRILDDRLNILDKHSRTTFYAVPIFFGRACIRESSVYFDKYYTGTI